MQDNVIAPNLSNPPGSGASRSAGLVSVGLLIVVCAVLFLWEQKSLPLTDPDEARCALLVRALGDNWIVPRLNGQPYFDKPAPFFWLAAAGTRLTGSTELGGRLVAALAGLAAVLVAYAFAQRAVGSPGGLLAGLILATSAGFLFLARWYRMDMLFLAGMWAAVWWFWRAEQLRAAGRTVRASYQWWPFYAIAAVATIFKGPAGLVLPALVVAVYYLSSRQFRRLAEPFNPVGILIYLAIAAPIYIAAELNTPGAFKNFFLQQNIGRFTGGVKLGHEWPGVLNLPLLLGWFLPWTVLLPGMAIRCLPLKRWADPTSVTHRLLWITAAVVVLFFSLSSTKLVNYIIPAIPPLAVLAAMLLTEWIRGRTGQQPAPAAPSPDRLMLLGGRSLCMMIALVGLAFVPLSLWLKCWSLWQLAGPAVAILAAATAWAHLGADRRGAATGWLIGGLTATALLAFSLLAPAGYDRLTARKLAHMATASEPWPRDRAPAVCFLSRTEISFLLYTNVREGEEFNPLGGKKNGLAPLREFLTKVKTTWALVESDECLKAAQEQFPGQVTVVGRHGGRSVIVLRDRPVATQPASGPD
jgi:4-amino-4-deoxy-L-arabinose transferase-like glycosyltransferase